MAAKPKTKICDFRTEINIVSPKPETRDIRVNICMFTEGMSAATRDGQAKQDQTLNQGGGRGRALPAKINRQKDEG